MAGRGSSCASAGRGRRRNRGRGGWRSARSHARAPLPTRDPGPGPVRRRPRRPGCSRCRGCGGVSMRPLSNRVSPAGVISTSITRGPSRWPPFISTARAPIASKASPARRRSSGVRTASPVSASASGALGVSRAAAGTRRVRSTSRASAAHQRRSALGGHDRIEHRGRIARQRHQLCGDMHGGGVTQHPELQGVRPRCPPAPRSPGPAPEPAEGERPPARQACPCTVIAG